MEAHPPPKHSDAARVFELYVRRDSRWKDEWSWRPSPFKVGEPRQARTPLIFLVFIGGIVLILLVLAARLIRP